MRKAKFKVEHLLSSDKKSEKGIADYYREQGYEVFVNYSSLLKAGRISSNDSIRALFRAYDSGYPDLLLRKDKEISFVEIKLDGDSLRPNQVLFLDKLAETEDVTVLYVNYLNKDLSDIKFELPSGDKLRVDIRKRISSLKRLVRKRGYKKFWIIAKLYTTYGDLIVDNKDILAEVASRTDIPSHKIIFFIGKMKEDERKNDALEPKEIEANITEHYVSKKKIGIRKRKERILYQHGINEFPEWAEELTVEQLLEKLKEK